MTKQAGSSLNIAAPETPRSVRRALVIVALAGYPGLVAAWVGLPALGVTGIAWAVIVGALGLAVILASGALYLFQRSMAQAPDAQLDERQIRVRDRAYLEAYRFFAVIVMLALLVGGILADMHEPTLVLTFELVQPLFWGAFLYSFLLPSAVVAWQEPDMPKEA